MKKILIIGLASMIGGVEMYVYNFAKHMNHDIYDVDFLLCGDTDKAIYADEIMSFWAEKRERIFYVPNLKKNYLVGKKWLKKFYKEHRYDVIYLNTCTAARINYCIDGLKNKNTKLITHSHNGSSLSYFNHITHRKYLCKKTDIFLACSDIAAKWMFGQMEFKAKLINNGIDLARYEFNEKNRVDIRNSLGIYENKIIIGHIGRFETQKNHMFLFELSKLLDNRYIFLLLGDGTLKNEFVGILKKNGVIDKFVILPSQADVERYYSAMDIFVLPSLYEGLPLVAVEAQTNGLECLLSDNISSQTDISGNCSFLSLDNVTMWKDAIEESSCLHNSKIDAIKKARYSIEDTVKSVCSYF